MVYHRETLSDIIHRYPIYDKEMYCIVHAYQQWNNYIMGNETIIHTDHKPFQFMHIQGRLHNDFYQKWSTYLQQFHLNIKYKKGNTNHVTNCLNRPLIVALTTILNSHGHETFWGPQLYDNDPQFIATYHTLGAGKKVPCFLLQDVFLCYGHQFCYEENLSMARVNHNRRK
jgi:hypothetical protein